MSESIEQQAIEYADAFIARLTNPFRPQTRDTLIEAFESALRTAQVGAQRDGEHRAAVAGLVYGRANFGVRLEWETEKEMSPKGWMVRECYRVADEIIGLKPTTAAAQDDVEAAEAIRLIEYDLLNRRTGGPGDDAVVVRKEVATVIMAYHAALSRANTRPEWRTIDSAPSGERILGYWVNGEMHTGSITDGIWWPAWEHDGGEWDLPARWQPCPSEPAQESDHDR